MADVLNHPAKYPSDSSDPLPIARPKSPGRRRSLALDLALVGLAVLVMAGGAFRVVDNIAPGSMTQDGTLIAIDQSAPNFDTMTPDQLANIATAAGGNR